VGPQSNEGSQHLRRQAAGSRDHSSRRWGGLLQPWVIRGWGEGGQSGLHLPKHLINAPRGAGSQHRRHRRWRI
jgi:hypothetical protein